TTRRSCPSAAADKGRPVAEHIANVEKLVGSDLERAASQRPPRIISRLGRDWADTRQVTGALERLISDRRFPLVPRLIHGLQFCQLITDCRRRKLEALKRPEFGELMAILEAAALEEAGRWFSDRQPPKRWAAALFRQAGGEYLQPHPRLTTRP